MLGPVHIFDIKNHKIACVKKNILNSDRCFIKGYAVTLRLFNNTLKLLVVGNPNTKTVQKINKIPKALQIISLTKLHFTSAQIWILFFTQTRFEPKLVYPPKKCVNCNKNELATKQCNMKLTTNMGNISLTHISRDHN